MVAKDLEERLEGGDSTCDYKGTSFDPCFFILSIRFKERVTMRLTRSKLIVVEYHLQLC